MSTPHFRRSGPAHTQAGFTLIEVMLVVGLVSVLASIAGPQLLTMLNSAREKRDIQEVHALLMSARSLARLRLTTTTVSHSDTTFYVLDATENVLKSLDVPSIEEVNFEDTDTIEFNKRGGLLDSSATSLEVETRSGHVYRWQLLPAIGTVRML